MSLSLNTDCPTSTTKALLVSIVAPRIFSTRNKTEVDVNEQKEQETETVATTASSSLEEQQPKIYDAPAAAVDTSALVDEVDVTPKEAEGEVEAKEPPPVPDGEHKAELLFAPAPAPLEPPTVEKRDEDSKEADDESKDETDESKEEEEEDDKVTPEEAAAVIKGKDPDDANINVEELIRITFQSLLEEWHLLNFPVYTIIHRRIEDTKVPSKNDDNNNNTPPLLGVRAESNDSASAHITSAWIQVQVMARPASLGAILDRLERIGVGSDTGTVSVFRAELCRTASPYAHLPVVAEEEEEKEQEEKKSGTATPAVSGRAAADKNANGDNNDNSEKDVEKEALSAEEKEKLKNERMIQEARQEWKNAATKLRIEQVREQIVEQSALSFDFISLLAVASILAGVGLITDNTVVIVASMLVSPIMGPVLGLTFGSRIQDLALVKSSLKNEVLALIGCVVIGVLVGLPSSFTNLAEDSWPTNEMQIRGEPTGLLTGIAIAIPSGMGVCLSILGGNTSSLVGVAISASLLPPAVNTGICFIYSFFLAVGAVANDNDKNAHDFAVIGGISLALTVINIVCIWMSGIVMFEIKEVAPTVQKSAFWAKDLKAARKWNKSSEGGEGQLPPVNIEVLQQGAKSALNQSQRESDGQPVEKVKFQPPPPRKKMPAPSLEDTLAMHESKANRAGLLGPLWGSVQLGPPPPTHEDDNVRYVGLEDMGDLLGFNAEANTINAEADTIEEDDDSADDSPGSGRRHAWGWHF